MTNPLPNELLNRVMRFNSHPTADIIRPYIKKIKSDNFFNRDIIDLTRKHLLFSYRLRHITNEQKFDLYVLSKILTYKYKVKYINQLPYKNDYIKRICRFKLFTLLENDLFIKRD
jgi:hypothetical protein